MASSQSSQGLSANHGRVHWRREHVPTGAQHLHSAQFLLSPLQVDEVISTSITLPVKERISKGMGVAGASNTLKVVTCNAVLGSIAVFARGAIRQFCVFAVVVLVAHWFLVHTFFVAVLSIDLQRLEAGNPTLLWTSSDSHSSSMTSSVKISR